MASKTSGDTEKTDSKSPAERPANTLLKSWGKRLAKGQAPVIPVYINGSWILNVPRGNKRVLRVVVPGKNKK